MAKAAYKLPDNQKYLFYVTTSYLTKQIQYYKLFVQKHGIPVETLVECLNELGVQRGMKSKREILGSSSYHFETLLKIITDKTGKTFTKSKKQRREESSYDRWWNARNMDGSFAYNGVTDDF